MKNILELCLSPDRGGLELYMVRASQFLAQTNNVVSVIGHKTKLKEYYEGKEYRYIQIKNYSPALWFLSAISLAKIIDDNKIDIVHLHWTKDLPIAVLAKKLSKSKPKLAQTRNMSMTRFKDDFYHRWLYRNLSLMLPVTNQVKEQLKRFIPQDVRPKIEVLYMGASEIKTLNNEDELRKKYNIKRIFTVGIVGRIEKIKRQYLVIDAVRELLNKGIDIQLLIVGHAMDESYLLYLKEQIRVLDMNKNVIFTGFTNQAQELMQLCDCLVLATPSETFGLVLIEAMRSQVAVIATNNAGPLEIIDNGIDGLLFEKDNSKDLAYNIEQLMNPDFNSKLAQKGFLKAAVQFDSKTQFLKLQQYLYYYNQC